MVEDIKGEWKDLEWLRRLKVTTQQQIYEGGFFGIKRLHKTSAVPGRTCVCGLPVFPSHGTCFRRTYILDGVTEICGGCLMRWPVEESGRHCTYVCARDHVQPQTWTGGPPARNHAPRQQHQQREPRKSASPNHGGDLDRFRVFFGQHFDPKTGKYSADEIIRASLMRWFEKKFAPAHADKSYQQLCRICQLHPDRAVDLPLDRDDAHAVFKYFYPILKAELAKEKRARAS